MTVGGHILTLQRGGQTTFCLYLVKCLTVTLRCAVNTTTWSLQHLPWSLSAKFVFRKRYTIHNYFKNDILVRWPATNLLILRKWCGFEKLITIMLFKIWPTNRFSKAKSYNFHFHKNNVTWPLSASSLWGTWPADIMTDWATDRLTDWLTYCAIGYLTGWQNDWLINWLNDWQTE